MSKHTKGPWRIGGLLRQIMEGEPGRGRVVATMPPWHEDNSAELEANAHLIAAAPDLLAALKTNHDAVKGKACSEGRGCQTCDIIAKAEGKS